MVSTLFSTLCMSSNVNSSPTPKHESQPTVLPGEVKRRAIVQKYQLPPPPPVNPIPLLFLTLPSISEPQSQGAFQPQKPVLDALDSPRDSETKPDAP